MRKLILAGLCLLFSGSGLLFAQNKTLGVGVTTPNTNAALHVESPTGNQGFIMPRLTTAQRNAMASLLSSTDKGLMLYDTDVSAIFIWDGTDWQSSSTFMIENPASVADAVVALTTGSGNAGRFTIQNTSSFSHAIYAESNGDSTSAAVHGNHNGEGFGVFGKSAGSKFSSAAVYGEHVGTGDAAGAFRISNAASTYSALYGETNGSGPAVYGSQIGLGRGGQFQITNAANTQAALRSYTAGTGNAGFYTINNAASDSSAIYSTTNGIGEAITALTTGTGSAIKGVTSTGFSGIYGEATGGVSNGVSGVSRSADPGSYAILGQNTGGGPAGVFNISSATNGSIAMEVSTGGTGNAGKFSISNATSTASGLVTTTMGSGAAILAENRGTVDGFAGNFANTDAGNNFPAIQASTKGTGSGVRVMQMAGTGPGMDIFMENTSSDALGFAVSQKGSGTAASFVINNAANAASILYSATNGLGDGGFFQIDNANSTNAAVKGRVINTGGVAGAFEIFNATNPRAAVFATTNGTGNAGVFEIKNTGNTFPALQANTDGSGFAINARHSGTSGDAIYGEHAGGNGSAGNFRISNTNNTASAVYASTTAAGGNAMSLSNDANGIAFTIWKGGMQITTNEVTTGGSLAIRASAYRITSITDTTFTVDFAPVAGEVFMVFNDTSGTIYISASGTTTPIAPGGGKTFIAFSPAVIRGF